MRTSSIADFIQWLHNRLNGRLKPKRVVCGEKIKTSEKKVEPEPARSLSIVYIVRMEGEDVGWFTFGTPTTRISPLATKCERCVKARERREKERGGGERGGERGERERGKRRKGEREGVRDWERREKREREIVHLMDNFCAMSILPSPPMTTKASRPNFL